MQKKGWETFTNNVIKKLNEKDNPIVFLLWGKDAHAKQEFVTNGIHKVFTAAHPSPMAGGKFFWLETFFSN
jgi:uracil-DNA glycosylase